MIQILIYIFTLTNNAYILQRREIYNTLKSLRLYNFFRVVKKQEKMTNLYFYYFLNSGNKTHDINKL